MSTFKKVATDELTVGELILLRNYSSSLITIEPNSYETIGINVQL